VTSLEMPQCFRAQNISALQNTIHAVVPVLQAERFFIECSSVPVNHRSNSEISNTAIPSRTGTQRAELSNHRKQTLQRDPKQRQTPGKTARLFRNRLHLVISWRPGTPHFCWVDERGRAVVSVIDKAFRTYVSIFMSLILMKFPIGLLQKFICIAGYFFIYLLRRTFKL
jgi:hypothetical protein